MKNIIHSVYMPNDDMILINHNGDVMDTSYKIKCMHTICDAFSMKDITIMLSTDGIVYSYNGVSTTMINVTEKIVSIGYNSDTIFLVSTLGNVYRYRDHNIVLLDVKNIVQVACQLGNAMFLTTDGIVYTFKDNTPTLIPLEEKIIQIACGMNHSLFLTVDGKVYTWNENRSIPTIKDTISHAIYITSLIYITIENIAYRYNNTVIMEDIVFVSSYGYKSILHSPYGEIYDIFGNRILATSFDLMLEFADDI